MNDELKSASVSAPLGAPERTQNAVPGSLQETTRRAEEYLRSARAPNTLKAYRSDLEDFSTWCRVDAGGLSPLPASPETVALYVADLAGRGLKASTIRRRMAAISQLHEEAEFGGERNPARTKKVRNTYRGVLREVGSLQEGAVPILISTLRRILAAFEADRSPAALRDRALLLLGFAGAFRRSEIAALRVGDLEPEDDGVRVLLRRSKTDQAGEGQRVAVPYGAHPETCPVRNLGPWLALLESRGRSAPDAPLFCAIDRHGNLKAANRPMDGESISRIVKRRAKNAGLDPSRYSGHSLRAGLITSASMGGANEKWIMNQTRHKSVAMVLRYTREAKAFQNNAASYSGM